MAIGVLFCSGFRVCSVFRFWQRHNNAMKKRNNTNCTLLPLLRRSLYLLLYKCPLLGQLSNSQLETEIHSYIFEWFDLGPKYQSWLDTWYWPPIFGSNFVNLLNGPTLILTPLFTHLPNLFLGEDLGLVPPPSTLGIVHVPVQNFHLVPHIIVVFWAAFQVSLSLQKRCCSQTFP